MTMMPDVMAKTRICAGLDAAFKDAKKDELTGWLDKLKDPDTSYMATDLLKDMNLDTTKTNKKGKYGVWFPGSVDVKSDEAHINEHIFGLGQNADRWWEPEAHAIATEGFARAIWLMYHDIADGNDTDERERREVTFWWECPATHVFRVFLLVDDDRITCIISTPPKKDHPQHYAAYISRRHDPRTTPKEWDVPDMGGHSPDVMYFDPILIVAPSGQTPQTGWDKKREETVPLTYHWPQLTGQKARDVTTAQPRKEAF